MIIISVQNEYFETYAKLLIISDILAPKVELTDFFHPSPVVKNFRKKIDLETNLYNQKFTLNNSLNKQLFSKSIAWTNNIMGDTI